MPESFRFQFPEYLNALEHSAPGMNLAALIGLGAVRISLTGFSDAPLSSSALNAARGMLQDALDAGAADFESDGEVMTVYTGVDDVADVADALTAKGYKLLSAQVEMMPQNGYIKLTNEDDIKNMQKMLDMFEDNDDVQNVWHNWEDAE